jgi:hypothetical protein
MNAEPNDPIIDVLLEETLGGVAPPDLSARILQAWSDLRGSGDGFTAPPLSSFSGIQEPEAPPIVVGSMVRAVHEPGPTDVACPPHRTAPDSSAAMGLPGRCGGGLDHGVCGRADVEHRSA